MKPEEIQEIFRRIRQERPLIHMIPNTVTATLCADGLSALGARPLMAVAPQEMEEIAAQADSIVVNLGQLNSEKIEAAELALKAAQEKNKPVVLDPVGCGASEFRLKAVQELLEIPWKGIVKGNQSEIYSIQQNELTREGIDSLKGRVLADIVPEGKVFLVSGETDRILWKGGRQELERKEKRSYNIVGSGCLLGAVAGACHCIEGRPQRAAEAAAVGIAYGMAQTEGAKGTDRQKRFCWTRWDSLKEKNF